MPTTVRIPEPACNRFIRSLEKKLPGAIPENLLDGKTADDQQRQFQENRETTGWSPGVLHACCNLRLAVLSLWRNMHPAAVSYAGASTTW
jgi:hypothetical protein